MTLATYFHKYDWLQKLLFSTNHDVGVLIFPALGSGYAF